MITKRGENLNRKKLGDDEIIQRYLQTQESWYFDELYLRYSAKVFAKCISMLKTEELASDATQDVFLKIYLNIAKFSGRSKFSTWLYSITYNYCIDFLRKKKKSDSLFVDTDQELPEIEDEIEDKQLLEIEVDRLGKVLDNLQVEDKAVLLMKYQDDMSIREIASSFGKTESAIKMKIKRAKQKAIRVYNTLFLPSQ